MSRDIEAPRRIQFHLEGDPRKDGLVLAQDLVSFLTSVLSVLRRIESDRGRKAKTGYRVVDLDIGSATVTLEAEEIDDYEAAGILSDFIRGACAVRDSSLEAEKFSPKTKRAFLKLLAPVKANHVYSVNISADSVGVEFRGEQQQILRLASGLDVHAIGEICGYIDAINVHREPVFFLYPEVGPTRVRCVFDKTQLDTVRSALKRYVTVVGLIEYAEGSPFASKIHVDRIEVHPDEGDLVSVESLFGSVPDLTGEMDSVSHVRQFRNAQE
jgi:hypothetical protein